MKMCSFFGPPDKLDIRFFHWPGVVVSTVVVASTVVVVASTVVVVSCSIVVAMLDVSSVVVKLSTFCSATSLILLEIH